MQEYSTRALVLDIEKVGERDGRVVLYTEELGKVVARAKSLYAINSKLAGHLQPLTIAQVRVVEKKGFQVVDALAVYRYTAGASPQKVIELLAAARLISELTSPQQPDDQLWELIVGGNLVSRPLLKILGFDPAHAVCSRCRHSSPKHFLLRDAVYLCTACMTRARMREGIVV